jgi:hypothetical protein
MKHVFFMFNVVVTSAGLVRAGVRAPTFTLVIDATVVITAVVAPAAVVLSLLLPLLVQLLLL